MLKKFPQRTILQTPELVALATATALPPFLRETLIFNFEGRPHAVADLRAEHAAVPADVVTDPFISALRRICHPSERLPGRHRKAILAPGREELGFLRLVLEEARTFCWREQSPAVLSELIPWLTELALRDRKDNQIQLALRALGYRNLVAAYTTLSDRHEPILPLYYQAGDFLNKLGDFAGPVFDAESLMALKMMALYGPGDEVDEVDEDEEEGDIGGDIAFDAAMASAGFERMLEESLEDSDSRVLHRILFCWVDGVLPGDEDKIRERCAEALACLDADCDPWLELYVHHLLARTLMTASKARIPQFSDLMEDVKQDFYSRREYFERQLYTLLELFWSRFDAKISNESFFKREEILEQLTAVEGLFEEFSRPELAVQFLSTRAECLRLMKPVEALNDLCDAVQQAEKVDPRGHRVEIMAVTGFLIRLRMKESVAGRKDRFVAVNQRCREILEPHLKEDEVFKKHLKWPPDPQKWRSWWL